MTYEDRARAAREALADGPKTAREVALLIGLPYKVTNRVLQRMYNQQLIRPAGSKRYGGRGPLAALWAIDPVNQLTGEPMCNYYVEIVERDSGAVSQRKGCRVPSLAERTADVLATSLDHVRYYIRIVDAHGNEIEDTECVE